jgi:hypothetical protein
MAFARTQRLIDDLNRKLQEKCPMLTMEFGLFSEMSARENVSFYEKNTELPIYLLCLNIKKNGKTHCISSISCKLSRNEMEISSKTHREHEGKKYNLLLRSAMILLAHHMRPITKVVSRAINPISAFSMVKYFNAHNADLNKYMEENEIDPGKITLVDIQNVFDEKNDLGMDVEMTEEEEAALMMENEDFGNITTLIVDLNDAETIQKTRKTFEDTLQRVGCTEGKGTKKRRKTRKSRKSRSYTERK